ncbi:hypothetical protein [Halosimplex salinum]|uniref:hypothetical protein n=1 Tax=Halosimplex salinum TaxID=1710538 RepID=UPI000F494E41|nr:hypothetical protein [Halosimplex salinum]
MSSTFAETDSTDYTRRHMTTLLLEERGDDAWVVTQGGVNVEGHGQTAAQAAADYCQRVENADL